MNILEKIRKWFKADVKSVSTNALETALLDDLNQNSKLWYFTDSVTGLKATRQGAGVTIKSGVAFEQEGVLFDAWAALTYSGDERKDFSQAFANIWAPKVEAIERSRREQRNREQSIVVENKLRQALGLELIENDSQQ